LLGILGAVAFQSSHRFREGATSTKLDSDVAAINQSIKVYLANGGSLAGVTDPAAVLDKLKTRREAADAAAYAGLRSDMIDGRVTAVPQTTAEANSNAPRAVWNATARRFEVARLGSGGIARFDLSVAAGKVNHGVETREAGAVDLNRGDGWIWNYQDVAAPVLAQPRPVPLTDTAPPSPVAVAPPGRLAAPVLSAAGGRYQYNTFPSTITLTNPNGTGRIMVARQWTASGIQWEEYRNPVAMSPEGHLLAYVQSTTAEHSDSVSASGTYEVETIDLQQPTIQPGAAYLDLGVNNTLTIALQNPNPSAYGSTIEYSILGGAYTAYTEPLAISPASYENGFEIAARVVRSGVGFRPSQPVTQWLPIKLKAPLIDKKQAGSIFTITLFDTNPANKGSLKYLIQDLNNGSRTAWSSYGNAFQIDGDKYVKGFEVITYAVATAARYLDSAESNVQGRSFFGTKVAERVVLVLDVSGSMSWNNRLNKVKDEAKKLLSAMPATGKAAVVTFSSGVSTRFAYQQTTSQKVTEAQGIINSLVASGGTNYIDALGTALTIVNANPDVEQVVFLSDGAPNGGKSAHPTILSRVDQIAAKGVTLSPIGFEMTTAAEKKLIQDMKDRGVAKPKKP
jgi:uncharacterized protein YegL